MEQVSKSSNHRGGKSRRCALCLAVGFIVAAWFAAPAFSAQQENSPPSLTYIKVMKGSVPEYTALTVDTNGNGTYDGRQLDESPRPRSLKLSPETTQTLFQMAAALDDFQSIKLESNKKVASLGLKTFIYRHNGQESKVEFNYTRNKRADDLLGVFEGIADVEQHIGTLEYSSHYDVLGLPSALNMVEIDLNNKALVDPQLMVPILKKIAGDSQYLHIAQVRAADILRRIQGPDYEGKSERR
ncbi:MAG TPA: hypothetical protein VFL79_09875 [Terriglobia bacterium]|nr:hypothetical protein [Terriglobia bacterium]